MEFGPLLPVTKEWENNYLAYLSLPDWAKPPPDGKSLAGWVAAVREVEDGMTEALQAYMDASRTKMRLLDLLFDREAVARMTPEERAEVGRQWTEAVRADFTTWEALTAAERAQAEALWEDA